MLKTPMPAPLSPPWPFKSLQTVGSLTFNSLSKISRSSGSWINNISPVKLGVRTKYDGGFRTRKKVRTPDEQGEAEQTAFASALSSGKKAAVLEFYSPKCRLCNSLLNFVLEVVGRNSSWLNIVMADAENENWLPGVLCFSPDIIFVNVHGKKLLR